MVVENAWTRTVFDGPFYVSRPRDPQLPATSLVFVQSRDGNTGASQGERDAPIAAAVFEDRAAGPTTDPEVVRHILFPRGVATLVGRGVHVVGQRAGMHRQDRFAHAGPVLARADAFH